MVNLVPQPFGLRRQAGCGIQQFRGGDADVAGRLADLGNVFGDRMGASRRLRNVARDLVRCRALLFDGGGDGTGDFVDLSDGRVDLLDGADGLAGGGLNALDLG